MPAKSSAMRPRTQGLTQSRGRTKAKILAILRGPCVVATISLDGCYGPPISKTERRKAR